MSMMNRNSTSADGEQRLLVEAAHRGVGHAGGDGGGQKAHAA